VGSQLPSWSLVKLAVEAARNWWMQTNRLMSKYCCLCESLCLFIWSIGMAVAMGTGRELQGEDEMENLEAL